MSILPELNNRIINRFDKLIAVAYELVEVSSDDYLGLNEYHTDVYEALIVNSSNLVRMVFADSPVVVRSTCNVFTKWQAPIQLRGRLDVLRAC